MTIDPEFIQARLQQMLRDNAQRASTIHGQFLDASQGSLEQLGSLLEMQIASVQGNPGEVQSLEYTQPAVTMEVAKPRPAPLFDRTQLEEFAIRSMAKCFGPEFSVFEGRRHPRIPNGDLLLMDRILTIDGQRHHFERPSSIVSEYDVPAEAWFYRNRTGPSLPYSVWMEMSLQPCGFLTAYLGTSLMFPEVDYFFRNLDGHGRLLAEMDVRGKTLTCQARLLSTTASGTTIIQKFAFEMACEGTPLFRGESIFGFFPPEGMANQVGLDAGKLTPPLYEKNSLAGEWIELNDPQAKRRYFASQDGQLGLAGGQLNYVDRVFIGGEAGDYIYALRQNDPRAWFYACHFHQDPVMPGSLGVEAILEALQVYALRAGLGGQFRSPCFSLPAEHTLVWKYRGQILPSHNQMKLEVKVTRVELGAGRVTIEGDASLWADAVRIYEVKHAAICVEEKI